MEQEESEVCLAVACEGTSHVPRVVPSLAVDWKQGQDNG